MGIGLGKADIFQEHMRVGGGIKIVTPPSDPPTTETNTTSLTLTTPSASAGDLLLALVSTDGNPSIDQPSGWYREAEMGGTAKSFVFYRVSDGIDAPSYTWDFSGAEDAVGKILHLKNVNETNPINARVIDNGTGTTVVIPSITTTEDKCMLVSLVSLDDGVLLDENDIKADKRTSLWIVNTSGEAIGSVGSSADYKVITKAGIVPSYSIDTTGSSTDYYSIQIAINPKKTVDFVPTMYESSAAIYKPSSTTISHYTPTIMNFTTVAWDMGGYFNTSQPSRLTVPKDGYYVVMGDFQSQDVWGGWKATRILKNNILVYNQFMDNRGSFWKSNPVFPDHAVAGDYYEIQFYTWANGYTIDIVYVANESPYFSIVRVG